MSLFFRGAMFPGAADLLGDRTAGRAGHRASVSAEQAMRHSAVWACRRLRADLISTLPLDVYRRLPSGMQVEVPKPPVLVTPGGGKVGLIEWLYSTQMDLDAFGNTFGIITEVNGYGLPNRIDLQPVETCVVRTVKDRLEYWFGGKIVEPGQVWHEKQFTLSGHPVGLSPLAYAAYSVGGYLGAQQFALDWFNAGGVPRARLKNSAKTLTAAEADAVKARYRASVATGDVFVHGADWEYDMLSVAASESAFIEALKWGVPDVCRFLGVPADMVDAESSTGHVTYANVTQRNLQLLVINLGPAISRRESALTGLTPKPQYVKANSDALLRMDPLGRAQLSETRIKSRTFTPDEDRELNNLPPLTEEQIVLFERLFPAKAQGATEGTKLNG